MAKKDSLLNIFWPKIIEKYSILDNIKINGQFIINAEQIKEFREPRLMTKFDDEEKLPEIFRQHNISILPITRGSYVISNFKVYQKLEIDNSPIIEVEYPYFIESIILDEISSESVALNIAYFTGMFQHFLSEDKLWPTLTGRMGSKSFEYYITNNKTKMQQKVTVDKSQIEIDGCYEGVNSIAVVEAKNIIVDNFLVRQLYYPYRLIQSYVNKPVRPIFMTYSNEIFSFYEFEFIDLYNYNSLSLVKSQRYSLKNSAIELDDIIQIFNSTNFVKEDLRVPFLQANTFERVISICEILATRKYLTKTDITALFNFEPRQSDYYINAGRYLGLYDRVVEDNVKKVKLTKTGELAMRMNTKNRNLRFFELMMQHKIFYVFFDYFINHNGEFPNKSECIRLVDISNVNVNDNDHTKYRRAQSVKAWLLWAINLTKQV